MTAEQSGLERMQEAVEVFLAWKAREDRESPEALLEEHAGLRELLEPLLEDCTDGALSASGDSASAHEGGRRRVFGDFRIVRELGRGGMGVVYEAEQASLDRRVALKVLPAAFAQEPKAIARFKREALTAARLEHQGIVRVLAVGSHEDIPYYAMELIDGVPLHLVLRHFRKHGAPSSGLGFARLVRDMLDDDAPKTRSSTQTGTRTERWKDGFVETLVAIAADVCEALAHAHTAGIVHRDVKPSNLMLRADGSVVLTDFGLAREYGLPSATLTGEFAGTPHYVSPEQARGQTAELGPASDVFSFGATLYEILTLEKPFDAATTHDVLEAIRRRDPADPSRSGRVPADLAAIVLKCLEKEPQKRYSSCSDVLTDLEAFRRFRPVTARRPGPVDRARRFVRRRPLESTLAVAGVLLTALAVYLITTSDERTRGQEIVTQEMIERELERGFIEVFARREKVARAHFRRVLDVDPTNAYALVGISWLVPERDQIEKTHAIVQAALKLDPENRATMRLDSAFRAFRGEQSAVVEMKETLGEPHDSAECFVAGCLNTPGVGSIRRENDMEKCASLFRRAIERSHRARLVHYIQWAMTVGRARKSDGVVETQRTLEILWPDSAMATAVGALALHFHDNDRAIEAYERALELDPELMLAYSGLANAYAIKREPEKALAIITRALEIDPDNHEMYFLRCIHHSQMGDYAAAVRAGRRAVEMFDTNSQYFVELGVAVERDVDDNDPADVRRGRLEALEIARKAAEISPWYDRAHRGIARLCKLLGDEEGEREEYLRWVRRNPGGAWAHMEFARYLLDQENPSPADLRLALRAARRSNRLYATDAGLILVLARALDANGKREEARAAVARAKQHMPDKPSERREIEQLLEEVELALGG